VFTFHAGLSPRVILEKNGNQGIFYPDQVLKQAKEQVERKGGVCVTFLIVFFLVKAKEKKNCPKSLNYLVFVFRLLGGVPSSNQMEVGAYLEATSLEI
jgi:hypothetical protein